MSISSPPILFRQYGTAARRAPDDVAGSEPDRLRAAGRWSYSAVFRHPGDGTQVSIHGGAGDTVDTAPLMLAVCGSSNAGPSTAPLPRLAAALIPCRGLGAGP